MYPYNRNGFDSFNQSNQFSRPLSQGLGRFNRRTPTSSGQIADPSKDTVDTLRQNGNLWTRDILLEMVSSAVDGKEFDLKVFQETMDIELEQGTMVRCDKGSGEVLYFFDKEHPINIRQVKGFGTRTIRDRINSGEIKVEGHGRRNGDSGRTEKSEESDESNKSVKDKKKSKDSGKKSGLNAEKLKNDPFTQWAKSKGGNQWNSHSGLGPYGGRR